MDKLISEDNSHALLIAGETGIVIKTNHSSATSGAKYPGAAKPTQTIPIQFFGTIAFWGDDNLFPRHVVEEVRKNTIIYATLEWKARALYGGGLVYGEVNGFDADGNEKFTPIKDSNVETFFRESNIRRYLIESITDFYWFYNAFPELILSKDGSEIVSISCQEAEYCRWSRRNPKNGLIENCYISANWMGTMIPWDYVEDPVVDIYWDVVGNVQRSNYKKFIYPLSYPTPGSNYYQLAAWNSIRSSGWYDVMQSIPHFKKHLFHNQLSIKYHIEIYTWYWKWKFKEWDSLSAADQRLKIKDELDAFQKIMTGDENASKSILTPSIYDEKTGRESPGWKITAIDSAIKDGIYIEDSQEGSSHLLYALGVHPTLVGSAPGKQMGAGSGSDQRVAFNNYISLCQAQQDILLEPLNFIRDYNGWNPNIEFRFKRPMIMTLDKGKQTQQEAS